MTTTAVGGDENEKPRKTFQDRVDRIRKSPAARDIRKLGYHLGLYENPSSAHPANQGMRDRGGVTQRNSHFTSSYSSARQVSGTCATCAIEKMQGY